MPHSLKNKIKSLCYKGELSEKERDKIIQALEQQPKMQDCEHCIHTYGTLGCCDMVNNEWIYDCEFGKEQYKKEHEQQPCEDCISRLIVQEEISKSIALKENPHQMYKRIQAIPSATPQSCEEENPNCTECRHYDKEKHHCPRFCRVIENTIAEITSDQARWIPCSERLPELGERVLCQCQANIYEVLKLTVDGWYYNPNHCYMESFVIAWMPLPQPYAESEE